jgi:hypothetical protein
MKDGKDKTFLPYEVWVEWDEQTYSEKVYDFALFEEAEAFFRKIRRVSNCKVLLRHHQISEYNHKIYASYHP